MPFVFMMPMAGVVGRIPLHPPLHPLACPQYCHHRFLVQQHQQQEEENYLSDLYEETMSINLKFTWTAPTYNMLKLNTDGSSKGNPGPSSFGGLIRDGKGRWLCGYIGKMEGKSYTSLEAEVWSVFKGLCLIKKKKISNVLIETDCQSILMIGMQGFGESLHPDFKPVVEAMNTIMIQQSCVIIHTRRDGNHCADQLAKLGGAQSEEYMDLEEPPVDLIPYLLRDIEAAFKPERNYHSY
ncbi:hypothetical protein LXL04_025153 [Taraxacum kok-saghyz]